MYLFIFLFNVYIIGAIIVHWYFMLAIYDWKLYVIENPQWFTIFMGVTLCWLNFYWLLGLLKKNWKLFLPSTCIILTYPVRIINLWILKNVWIQNCIKIERKKTLFGLWIPHKSKPHVNFTNKWLFMFL